MSSFEEQESQIVPPVEPAYFTDFNGDHEIQADQDQVLPDIVDESQSDPNEAQVPTTVVKNEGAEVQFGDSDDEVSSPALQSLGARTSGHYSHEDDQPNGSDDCSVDQDSLGTHVAETQFVGLEPETQQESLQSADVPAVQHNEEFQPCSSSQLKKRTSSEAQTELRQTKANLTERTTSITANPEFQIGHVIGQFHQSFKFAKAPKFPSTQNHDTKRDPKPQTEVQYASTAPVAQKSPDTSEYVVTINTKSSAADTNNASHQPRILQPQDTNVHVNSPEKCFNTESRYFGGHPTSSSTLMQVEESRYEQPVQTTCIDHAKIGSVNNHSRRTRDPVVNESDRVTLPGIDSVPRYVMSVPDQQTPTPRKTPMRNDYPSNHFVRSIPFPALQRTTKPSKEKRRRSLADRGPKTPRVRECRASSHEFLEQDDDNDSLAHCDAPTRKAALPYGVLLPSVDGIQGASIVACEKEPRAHDEVPKQIPTQAEDTRIFRHGSQSEDVRVQFSQQNTALPNTLQGINIQSRYTHESKPDNNSAPENLKSDRFVRENRNSLLNNQMAPQSDFNSKSKCSEHGNHSSDDTKSYYVIPDRGTPQVPPECIRVSGSNSPASQQNISHGFSPPRSKGAPAQAQINRPLTAAHLRSDSPQSSNQSAKLASRVQKRGHKEESPIINLRHALEACTNYHESQSAVIQDQKKELAAHREKAKKLERKMNEYFEMNVKLQSDIKLAADNHAGAYKEQTKYIEEIVLRSRIDRAKCIEAENAMIDSNAQRTELANQIERRIDNLKSKVRAGLYQAKIEVDREMATNQTLRKDLERMVIELGKSKENSQNLNKELKEQKDKHKELIKLLASNQEAILNEFINNAEQVSSVMQSGISNTTKIDELSTYAKNLRIPEGIAPYALTAQLDEMHTRLEAKLKENNVKNVQISNQYLETLRELDNKVLGLSSGLEQQTQLKRSIEELRQINSSLEDNIKTREADLMHAKNSIIEQAESLTGYYVQEQKQSKKLKQLEEDLATLQNNPVLSSQYESQLQNLKRANEELSGRLSEADKECSDLKASHRGQETLKKELVEAQNNIRKYITEKEQHDEAIQKAVTEACAKIFEEGKSQLKDLKLQRDVTIKALRQAIEKLSQEKKNAEEDLAKTMGQVLNKDGVIDQLHSEAEKRQEEHTRLNEQILKLQKEIDRQDERIEGYQLQHQTNEEELQRIKNAQQEHTQASLSLKEQGEKKWMQFENELKIKDALEQNLLLSSEKNKALEEEHKQLQQSIESQLRRKGIITEIQSINDFLQSPPSQDLVTPQSRYEESQPESFGSLSYDPSKSESQIVSANSTRPRQSRPVTRSASLILQTNNLKMIAHDMVMPSPRLERRVAPQRVSDTCHVQQSLTNQQKSKIPETAPSWASNTSEYFSKDVQIPPISEDSSVSSSSSNSAQKQIKSAMRKSSSRSASDFTSTHRSVEFAASPPQPISSRSSEDGNDLSQELQSQSKTPHNNTLLRSPYNRPVSGGGPLFAKELHASTYAQESSSKLSPPMPIPRKNKRAGSGSGCNFEQQGPSKKPRVSISVLKVPRGKSPLEIPDSQDARLI